MVGTCEVSGNLVDIGLAPISNAELIFAPITTRIIRLGNSVVLPSPIAVRSDFLGNVSINLAPARYNVSVQSADAAMTFNIVVPDQPLAEIAQLIELPPPVYLDAAQQAVVDAQSARDQANADAASASASADIATVKAADAAGNASAADSSAGAAASSADAASVSASDAAASAALVDLGELASAKAATAADRVQTGLDRAATSADAGTTATARTAAESARDASLINATTANTQASAAYGSATSAAASATTAISKADIATTQAGNAAASAATATMQATAASGSATSAAASATTASTQAGLAAAAYDAFDDRYLGSKSANPALDNDGAALLTGALYFNTASNEMRVWTGAIWAAAYVSSSGALMSVNNLSDVANPGAALTNLGGTATGKAVFLAADATAARAAIGAVIGTDVQAYDADLAALAAIAGVEGDLIYRNATGWTRLQKGGAGQVLTQNAGLTAPEWAAPAVAVHPTFAAGTLDLLNVYGPAVVFNESWSAAGTSSGTVYTEEFRFCALNAGGMRVSVDMNKGTGVASVMRVLRNGTVLSTVTNTTTTYGVQTIDFTFAQGIC